MIILGLSGAHDHDPAAAILVDGEIVAAVEEERLVRERHARQRMPVEAARYCLRAAGVTAKEVDVVAFPYASIPITDAARWRYAWRNVATPDLALSAIFDGNRRFRRMRDRVLEAGRTIGVNWARTQFVPVAHQVAHASSAYHASGFTGKTAILVIGGRGEYATTFMGYGENGRIHKLDERYEPDSLAGLYGALTRFLGLNVLGGECRVMTMAASGDPGKHDLSRLVDRSTPGRFKVDRRYVHADASGSDESDGVGFVVSQRLVEWLEPLRQRNGADVDLAASIQRLFEDVCLELIETRLGDIIRSNGQLAFAGGGAFNASLNRRILERGDVTELFVPPAAGDAGSALGAATFVAADKRELLRRMRHAYLGPGFTTRESIEALEARVERPHWRMLKDVPKETAALLAAGHPVAWFQGRMEFGPQALGGRAILGCPNAPGIIDKINTQLESRDRWRPLCASVLDRVAADIMQGDHAAPFMTVNFEISHSWRARIPSALHADGTAILQIVERDTNPRYYRLLEELERLTGNAVVLSTALNRADEPIVCSPDDVLALFYDSALDYLVMEDILVTKEAR